MGEPETNRRLNIILDECVGQDWFVFLEARGCQVRRWVDVGPSGADDEQVVTFAAANADVLLTADGDFGQLAYASRLARPSIVRLGRPGWRATTHGPALLAALAESTTRGGCHYVRLRVEQSEGRTTDYTIQGLPLGPRR